MSTRQSRNARSGVGALLLVGSAAVGVVQFYRPETQPPSVPFAHLSAALAAEAPPTATPTPDAFGRSGEVKVRFARPGAGIEFPLAVEGSAEALSYQWVSVVDSAVVGPVLPLNAAFPIVPEQPGFYHLSVLHGERRQIVAEPTVAVIVPFERKLGQWLNGYRIGEYLAERIGGKHERPEGFIEVRPELLGLSLSRHIKLADFVTHDEQINVWPKYVVVDPLLLDKLELVLTDIGERAHADLSVDVHSGFRAPAHNRGVRRAARDSRHQYGDAADVQIDANGDGRIDMTDELLVMLAVERVEDAHPDLVGGLGMYTSRRYRTPYLHIDTRGKRSRWHG